MASLTRTLPRSSFALSSRQLQQIRHSSSSTSSSSTTTTQPFPTGLFKAPAHIIKKSKVFTGAQEWATSAYHYNKQTTKTLPTAQATADRLIRDYSTMIESRGIGSTGASSTARYAVSVRRKSATKMYVSGTQIKDYGDKMVIKAFVYDAREAAKNERQERDEKTQGRKGRPQRSGGSASGGGRR